MFSRRRSRRKSALRGAAQNGSRLGFETLEDRLLLYSPMGQTWATPDLSFSYVPDGSAWKGQTSALFATLDEVAPREVWQREFARALQTWANQTNLNFHLSPDDGSLGGIQGDIRLAAIQYSSALAYAAGPTRSVSGGDITLNAKYAYAFLDQVDLYSVLLHESGHSLGLRHSQVVGSIMRACPVAHGLSPDDIAGIQFLYGVRQEDAFDQLSANNDFASATDLALADQDTADWRADLTSHADVDYYRVTIPDAVDVLSVAVDARELSLLAPKVAVYDQFHRLVATASGDYGTVAMVDVPVAPGQTYTVVADGATNDEFGMGAYRLDLAFARDETQPPPTSPVVPPPTPPIELPETPQSNDAVVIVIPDQTAPETAVNSEDPPVASVPATPSPSSTELPVASDDATPQTNVELAGQPTVAKPSITIIRVTRRLTLASRSAAAGPSSGSVADERQVNGSPPEPARDIDTVTDPPSVPLSAAIPAGGTSRTNQGPAVGMLPPALQPAAIDAAMAQTGGHVRFQRLRRRLLAA